MRTVAGFGSGFSGVQSFRGAPPKSGLCGSKYIIVTRVTESAHSANRRAVSFFHLLQVLFSSIQLLGWKLAKCVLKRAMGLGLTFAVRK